MKKKILVGFRASEDLIEKLEEQCKDMGGISRSSVINIILNDYFKDKEKALKDNGGEVDGQR